MKTIKLDNEKLEIIFNESDKITISTVANLMAEWAAKNCSIPAVSKSLKCDCSHSGSCRYEAVIAGTNEICRHKE